jgi:hypothetical protein
MFILLIKFELKSKTNWNEETVNRHNDNSTTIVNFSCGHGVIIFDVCRNDWKYCLDLIKIRIEQNFKDDEKIKRSIRFEMHLENFKF